MLYKTSPIVSKRLYGRTETNSIDNLESYGRSWSPVAQAVWKHPVDKPLLRTWDDLSGSQPDGSGDMSARASDMSLATFEARRSSLQTHIIHRDWTPTPYISFTSSPEALENLANFRKSHPRRKHQTITVVDPAVRLESGWPIISYGEEKDYYRIEIPYGIPDWELRAHHLCLWTVKAEEIIQHYEWDKLSSDPNWYHNIVCLDFKRFREERQRREQEQVQHRIDDISVAFGTLHLNSSSSPSSSTASDRNTDNEPWEDTDRNQPTKQHIQSLL
ncbi:hypothetical protein LZL87_002109 [Fusarium oxysporum]|nr:hypothetical protein LZL87_002109 [Fusarium oxysporum]